MKAGVGSIDKAVRMVAALVLFRLYFILEWSIRYIAFVGIIPPLIALGPGARSKNPDAGPHATDALPASLSETPGR